MRGLQRGLPDVRADVAVHGQPGPQATGRTHRPAAPLDPALDRARGRADRHRGRWAGGPGVRAHARPRGRRGRRAVRRRGAARRAARDRRRGPEPVGLGAAPGFYEATWPPASRSGSAGRSADLDRFGTVVLATGAVEASPLIDAGALGSAAAIAAGPGALAGAEHVVVVDDGFGVVARRERRRAGAGGGSTRDLRDAGDRVRRGIPGESRVQLLQRLAGRLEILPLTLRRRSAPTASG